ncbi:uncharacterized protein LOC111639461 [Centruroides sculpturatus]|uniref:uncharacterized protein LOC111639461 n=1 Tax=Centruroides sculpturatus TaxID=218467 RepID=UPI000C6D7CC7|nr:uncharacterized protein LOC111639461 [Centruroides sculpturatus]
MMICSTRAWGVIVPARASAYVASGRLECIRGHVSVPNQLGTGIICMLLQDAHKMLPQDALKMLLQEIWRLKLFWDEPMFPCIDHNWRIICKELGQLWSIQISRKTLLPNYMTVDLHAFFDASQKGYGAVVYMRSSDEFNVWVRLLTSKTREAPLKSISILRMELCAVVLLVHLLQAIQGAFQIKINSIFAWSDSTIVLSWLKADPSRLQVFVANRVSEIQSVLHAENWNPPRRTRKC